MLSRVTQQSDGIYVHLSQTGRRAALSSDIAFSLTQTERIYQQGEIALQHGQTLQDRENQVLPIVRFTSLTNKYHAQGL